MPRMGDRDDIMGSVPEGTFMYCMTCERTYISGEHRKALDEDLTLLEMCPYENCDGDTVIGGKEWEWVRGYIPEYPEIPERGVVYPLNG